MTTLTINRLTIANGTIMGSVRDGDGKQYTFQTDACLAHNYNEMKAAVIEAATLAYLCAQHEAQASQYAAQLSSLSWVVDDAPSGPTLTLVNGRLSGTAPAGTKYLLVNDGTTEHKVTCSDKSGIVSVHIGVSSVQVTPVASTGVHGATITVTGS